MRIDRFGISRVMSPSVVSLSMLLFVGGLMTARPVQAASSYHLINAKAVGQDVGGGRTTASVINGGLLQGTVTGNLVITSVVGTIASFTNTITFTNQTGSLTAVLTGAIDLTNGQYNASGAVTEGTGKLAGATGSLALSGAVNFATALFAEDITGAIRVDLAP